MPTNSDRKVWTMQMTLGLGMKLGGAAAAKDFARHGNSCRWLAGRAPRYTVVFHHFRGAECGREPARF